MVLVALFALASDAQADEELPNAVPTVLYKRWAAAVAYGPSFVSARTDAAQYHTLVFFELAVRYRLIRELEIGGSIGGSLTRALGYVAFYADARYRWRAEMPWNAYLFASIGSGGFAPQDGKRLLVRAGAGVERRLKSWAFAADVQLVRISGNADVVVRGDESAMSHHGALGVAVTAAALYYWGSGGPSLRRHGVP